MKTKLVLLVALALAGAAAASVDPTRPMLTGRGNVNARPANVIVTNQTAPATAPTKTDEPVALEKFQVTGSLLPHAAAPAAAQK